MSPLTKILVSVLFFETANIFAIILSYSTFDSWIKISPLELIVKVKGSCSSGSESAELYGKSTCTPTVSNGAVTINIINKTNITSTNGVTFISLIGSLSERLNLKDIV